MGRLVLFLVLVLKGGIVLAESKAFSPYRLIDEGLTYDFEEIPIYDTSNSLMYKAGRISVSRADGEVISLAKYDQSPGCESDFPVIRTLEVPLASRTASPKQKKQKFVAFCGSYDGRHKTLRFYNPAFGFVSAVDFFDGPVALLELDSKLLLTINYSDYFSSIESKVSYPLVYELLSNGLGIELLLDRSGSSKVIYSSDLDGKRKSEPQMIRELIASALSEGKEEYCSRLLGNTEEKAKLIQLELETKLNNISIPKC